MAPCHAADEGDAQASVEPSDTITLADCMALVLERSPSLAVFSYDVRAAEARQLQASLRPNPEISIEIENIQLDGGARTRETSRTAGLGMSEGGITPSFGWDRAVTESSSGAFSESEVTLSISQAIELGRKRQRRIELASTEREMVSWDYEIARADIFEQTATAFVEVLAAQERVALRGELVALAEQVLETVSARVRAGRVSPLEEQKAATALASARLVSERSNRDLDSARTQLASLWGESKPSFEKVEGNLEKADPAPELEEALQLVKNNPDVARWKAELERRDAVVTLERANAKPDISVTAGIRAQGTPDSKGRGLSLGPEGIARSITRSESEDDWRALFVVGLSIPLPLFDRNQGRIQEAEHLAAKAVVERHATRVTVEAALTCAYNELSNAQSSIKTLESTMLPAASDTFHSFDEAYRQGKSGFLDVLDAQRTLFEAKEQYIEVLADYHRSVAKIERLTGKTLVPFKTGQE